MSMLAETLDAVIGVDTHTDTHTACLLDHLGREIGILTAPASPEGYATLIAWALAHAPGPRLVWALEGCRSHGLGLLRTLHRAGHPSSRPAIRVVPAAVQAASPTRPMLDKQLSTRWPPRLAQPRADGVREALRILLMARSQANTTRTATVNLLKALIVTHLTISDRPFEACPPPGARK